MSYAESEADRSTGHIGRTEDAGPGVVKGPSRLSADARPGVWTLEGEQFGRVLEAARAGKAPPAALVGRPGSGKTALLSHLLQQARDAGDAAIHLHLDRYFSADAFASRACSRLIELNPHLLDELQPQTYPDVRSLPQLLRDADGIAAQAQRAIMVGLSGWDALFDTSPDKAVFEAALSVLETARGACRHTLVITELRAEPRYSDLEALARSGLVYLPVEPPGSSLVEKVLEAQREDRIGFAPEVAAIAAEWGRGNLHRVAAAARVSLAKAAAQGLRKIGPEEWQEFAPEGFGEEIEKAARAGHKELLQAVVDWPAAGHIPVKDLLWRLTVLGVAAGEADAAALLETLEAGAPTLGLRGRGETAHLRFEWPEVRAALARAVLSDHTDDARLRRRSLQARTLQARDSAEGGRAEEAIEELSAIAQSSLGEDLSVFRRQAVALASELWRGAYAAPTEARAKAAEVIVAAGPMAANILAAAFAWPEPQLQQAAASSLIALGEDAVPAVAEWVGVEDLDTRLRTIAVLERIPCIASAEAVGTALRDPDAELRVTGLGALSVIGLPVGGELAAELLVDEDPTTRVAAINCIAEIGHSPGVQAVAERLIDDLPQVRESATQALLTLNRDSVLPALVNCLSDRREGLRTAGAKTLGLLGEQAQQILASEMAASDARRRVAAIRALQFFPSEQAIPPVLAVLREQDEETLEAATECLAAFGSDAVGPVAELLAARKAQAAAPAARVLALIGEPAVPALERHVESPQWATRVAVADAFGQMRRVAALPQLDGLARDKEPQVRLTAVQAIGLIGDPEGLPTLAQALSDENSRVVSEAARGVSQFGAAAMPALLKHLVDGAGQLVEPVGEALAEFGQAATEPLCALLEADDTRRRAGALEVLSRTKDPSGAGPVSRCLADESLRETAGALLASLGESAVSPLLPVVGSSAHEEAAAARDVLLRIGAPVVAPAIARLEGVAGDERARLAGLLGRLRDARAVDPLTALTSDVEPSVRAATGEALVALDALAAAAPLIADPDTVVREKVLATLTPHGAAGVAVVFDSFADVANAPTQVVTDALAQFGDAAREYLTSTLAAAEAAERAAATRMLCPIADDAALGAVAALLSDADSLAQSAAADGMCEAGGRAVRTLLAAATAGSPDLRAPATQCLVRIGEPSVAPLIAASLDSQAPARPVVIETLVAINPPGLDEQLPAWLRDGDEQVRIAAAGAVPQVGSQAVLEPLIDSLKAETPGAASAKAEAIHSFGEAAVPRLLERFLNPSWSESAPLAEAMARFGPTVRHVAVKMLQGASLSRRLTAVRTLESVGTPEELTALTAAVLDPESEVRQSAARALAKLGELGLDVLLDQFAGADADSVSMYAETIVGRGEAAFEFLLDRVKAAVPETRAAAIQVLAHRARPADQAVIASSLSDPEGIVRMQACRSLGSYPNLEAAEGLAGLLYDPESAVVEAATEALSRIGKPAYDVLIPRVVNEDGDVDEQVIRALAGSGTEALSLLRDCLKDPSATVRSAAAISIGHMGAEEAIEDLVPMLSDEEEQVRAAIATGLAKIGPAVVEDVLGVLKAGVVPACMAAADVLGELGAESFEVVLPVVGSRQAGARAASARALGLIGNDQAAGDLVARLRDSDALVRREAVRAIGRLSWVRATPNIIGLLRDAEADVAEEAARALTSMGEPAAEALLQRVLTDQGEASEDVVHALACMGEVALAPLTQAVSGADAPVRIAALDALSRIGGTRAVLVIRDTLFEASAALRTEALRGLRAVGAECVPAVIEALPRVRQEEVLEQLVDILADLGEASLPAVIELLLEPDESLWPPATEAIGRMGAAALPRLRGLLTQERPEPRVQALRAIAIIGDRSVVPDVIELLQVEDTGVVGEAIQTLAELGDHRAVLPIVGCIGAESSAIRAALQTAIPHIGAPAAEPIADLIVSKAPRVAEQAGNALRWLGKHAVPALVDKLNVEASETRVAAARVMGTLDVPGTVGPLVAHLGDPDEGVRRVVAEALGQIGGAALPAVLDQLTHPEETVADTILMTLHAIGEDPVYALIEQARHPEQAMRLAAIRMTGRLGRDEAIPTLVRRLHDTSVELNKAAAEALGQIGTPEAVRALAEEITSDNEQLVATARGILTSRASLALPILVRLAARPEGEPDADYVRVAAEVSAHARDELEELLSDDDGSVRRAASVVLGSVGDKGSLRTLVRKARDPDAPVRRTAAMAFGYMGAAAVKPLSGMLEDEDAEVRRSAADVLAGLDSAGVRTLIKHLRSAEDPDLQAVICAAFGKARVVEAIDALRETASESGVEIVRIAASTALVRLGVPEGMSALENALSSEDDEVRVCAAQALAGVGGDAALALVPLVNDRSEGVREAAVQVLQQIGVSHASLLFQFAEDPDPGVRAGIAHTLRKAPATDGVFEVLIALLHDEDESVCEAAAHSLSSFGEPAALQALAVELNSGDKARRYAACWALDKFGSDAVDLLVEAARDEAWDVRVDALLALGRIGDPRAREVVEENVEHADGRVRSIAASALERLGADEAASEQGPGPTS